MKRILAARPACALTWSVLLLVPLGVILAIGLPWRAALGDLEAQIATTRDQLNRFQTLIATLPALRAELERVQADESFKAFYFDAETPALAGAQLQREVQEMVRTAGARPISAQILPVDAEEQPLKVRARIQLQGTTDELLDVLYRVESARPFLFMDQMSIRSTAPRARSMRSRARRGGANTREVGQLTVRLDVFGYVLSPGG